MPRTLLNGQLSGRSGLGIPAGLKMGERVIELIFIAKDVAGTQSDATIDGLNRLVRPSAEGMGSPKKTVRIGEVGVRIDGSPERPDCLHITPLRDRDEAMRKISPGFPGIRRDCAIGPFPGFCKGRLAILPALKRAPCKANGAQGMGLRVAGVQLDGAIEHAESLFGACVRMLTVEEHAADKTLPGIQALWWLPFQAVMLCRIDFRLNAADHAVGDFVLNREHVVERPVVAFRPQVIAGCRLDELPGDPDAVAALSYTTFEDVTNPQLASDLADIHVSA